MATFETAEKLFDEFKEQQSVGGQHTEGNEGTGYLRIFQPDRGLDVTIKNVNNQYREPNDFSTNLAQDSGSRDARVTLGTITLNNRDYWENVNFNENNFQPYLTGKRRIADTTSIIDGNGDDIVERPRRLDYSIYQFSIDAVPFVINPNTDEIIRLDRYYDKDMDSEKYQLASEGKINYYLMPRQSGRTEAGNIDTYGLKQVITGYGNVSGRNNFDGYAESESDKHGFHLFKLNWGDGSPIEYTDKTLILESTTLLEHFYDKPGFYTISGVVMTNDFNGWIGGYEQFETNILINPSENYELNLFDYTNFATIGGVSKDSVLMKSTTNMVGYNPIDFSDEKVTPELIEKLNLLDRFILLDFFTKIDSSLVENFTDDLLPYTQEINDETETIIDTTVFGCMNPNADNYDSLATVDNGLCAFSFTLSWQPANEGDNLSFPSVMYHENGLNRLDGVSGYNQSDYVFNRNEIQNGQNLTPSGQTSLPSEAFVNGRTLTKPVLFFRFYINNEVPNVPIQLNNSSRNNFSLEPIITVDGNNNLVQNGQWYAVVATGGGDGFIASAADYDDGALFFTIGDANEVIDPVTQVGFTAEEGENWYPLNENTSIDFYNEYTGPYHIHEGGAVHMGEGEVGDEHVVPNEEVIVNAEPPILYYKIVLHNSPSVVNATRHSKIQFPSGININDFTGLGDGFPENNEYRTNSNDTADSTVANFVSETLTLPHPPFGHADEFTTGKVVRIVGDKLVDDSNATWKGWFRDADFTNMLPTNHKARNITLGDPDTYGGVEGVPNAEGVLVINLYAKVEVDIEF